MKKLPSRRKPVMNWRRNHAEQLKAYHAAYYADWLKRNADRKRFAYEVLRAKATGKIVRGTVCEKCGRTDAKMIGYSPDLTLETLTWICPSCRQKL